MLLGRLVPWQSMVNPLVRDVNRFQANPADEEKEEAWIMIIISQALLIYSWVISLGILTVRKAYNRPRKEKRRTDHWLETANRFTACNRRSRPNAQMKALLADIWLQRLERLTAAWTSHTWMFLRRRVITYISCFLVPQTRTTSEFNRQSRTVLSFYLLSVNSGTSFWILLSYP